MPLANWLPILFLFLVIYFTLRGQRSAAVKKVMKKRKLEGNTEMVELAKKFIDKECLIYAFDSNHQFEGVIKEVTNGAILLEKAGKIEAINLDFVIRIREYPTDKKGKKKTVILD